MWKFVVINVINELSFYNFCQNIGDNKNRETKTITEREADNHNPFMRESFFGKILAISFLRMKLGMMLKKCLSLVALIKMSLLFVLLVAVVYLSRSIINN